MDATETWNNVPPQQQSITIPRSPYDCSVLCNIGVAHCEGLATEKYLVSANKSSDGEAKRPH